MSSDITICTKATRGNMKRVKSIDPLMTNVSNVRTSNSQMFFKIDVLQNLAIFSA